MMLSCKEITELVTDYFEGRLSFYDRLRFRFHAGMCRHCRKYVRQMKETVRDLGRLPQGAIPPEAKEALMQGFRNWKR